jgi:DNA-binding transcriptional MerR regulator/methylmalonyl-CoA mutase cobalamin-binding subunit
MKNNYIYPIKVVSNKTGLTTHAIRAWEKRYSTIEPGRTNTNRRLYCEKDIQRLIILAKLTQAGYSIGTIANLKTEELENLLFDYEKGKVPTSLQLNSQTNKYLLQGTQAIEDLDEKRLDEVLSRASVDLSQPDLIQQVFVPLIKQLGENWKNGTLRIYHEHLSSSVIRTFLSNLRISHRAAPNASNIIVATPKGQMHELGALLVAAVAAAEGWRVTYLGPNLPIEEIAAAVSQSDSVVLALSLVYPPDDPIVHEELTKILKLIPEKTKIFVGGNAVNSYSNTLESINAIIFNDFEKLRKELKELSEK